MSDGVFWETVWPSLRIAAGMAALLFGMMGMMCGLDFLVDPVGAQQADDINLFGMPPSTGVTLVTMFLFFIICTVGVWLLAGTARRLPA